MPIPEAIDVRHSVRIYQNKPITMPASWTRTELFPSRTLAGTEITKEKEV
ncbi:MAG: hypothetical protein IJ231_02265 [Clostridia bacterium]|nr:hypothetical protein [Clostridia bacterium]